MAFIISFVSMNILLFQVVLPFVLSAVVVILITVLAEKYGTKIGGIIGTLPTTIIIAFVFIALNKDVEFASNAVSVVPAEMGINLFFLVIFAVFAYRSIYHGLFFSFLFWIILSYVLLIVNIMNIYVSLAIFVSSVFVTFLLLEKVIKVSSVGSVKVHYTKTKILFRGILTGTIIAISVLLSNTGEVISGIFSVFPAILSSTMIISFREHGPDFSAGMAKSMIFGSSSVMSYAVSIHFLYPAYGIFWGSIFAFCISLMMAVIIFNLRSKIR